MVREPARTRLLLALALAGAALTARAAPIDDALAAYDSGKYKQAAGLLQPLADSGNPVAQLKLGLLHYFGNGVVEDERKAIDYLKKAAAQGNLDAMYQLGNAYTFGNETAKISSDPDVEAVQWYFQAAKAGHRDAQYALGLMFLAGKGVVQSQDEAIGWIRKAAAQGHREAEGFVKDLPKMK